MRQRFLWGGSVLLACILVSGCGKTKTTAALEASEMAKIWSETAQVLATVKDKQTAAEAKPKLLEIADRIKKKSEEDLKRQASSTRPTKAPTVPEARKKMIAESYGRFTEERQRVVKNVEGGQELMDAFDLAALRPSPTVQNK